MRPVRVRGREKTVQAQVTHVLRSAGALVYTLGTVRRRGDHPGTMQSRGLPDLYAFLPIREGVATTLWVECKAPGGRLRPEQTVFREECHRRWHPHVVGGVNEVLAFLVQGGWVRSENVPHYRRHRE